VRLTPAQGKPTALWRVLSVLPYLVPLMGSLAYGQDLCVLRGWLAPCAGARGLTPRAPGAGLTRGR